jgi:hypothetical protein
MAYPFSELREYIEKSELREFAPGFRVRLSADLAKKYDAGAYDVALNNKMNLFQQVQSIGIKYPSNARPVLYVYIVPDENFEQLLRMPVKGLKCGGRPVDCFDLDGFKWALGISHNMLILEGKLSDISKANTIHEYAHLIHGQFFYKEPMCKEGFAEVIAWYVLNYESKVKAYADLVKNLAPEEIYTANELLNTVDFHSDSVPGKCCSFQKAYISSYLFIRGIIQKIEEKFNVDKVAAVQKFLELMRLSANGKEFLVYELADFIGMDREELLREKSLQCWVQSTIAIPQETKWKKYESSLSQR